MTPHAILDLVARARGVLVSQLRGQLRHRRIAQARHEAAFLLRHETMLSYPDIGKALGNRDHTTVMWSVAKVEAQIAKDPSYRTRLRAIVRPTAPACVSCSGCIGQREAA